MRQRYGFLALLVLAEGLVALDLDLPLVRPIIAMATVVGLPTLVLFRRMRFLDDHAAARLLFAFGSSVLGLVLVGLLLNTVLPVAGVDRPLQPAVLAATSLLANLGLLAWRRGSGSLLPADTPILLRRSADARLELAQALAAASVVLAVVGAVRLNNGAGGGVALVALVLTGAALVVLMVRAEGSVARDLRCLWLVAVSLLLATSLRGWSITGHDIQSEYLTFLLTNDAQRWQMSSWENAYNACLSLNILPTVLAQTTGLPGVLVFKLLLQLVFALVPVLTFLLARRFLSRRLALASAVLTMALPTFYTDMPYLVRQEVAFFFLGLLLLAATAPAPRRPRIVLAVVFGVGVVLSHYSTTYLLLLGLVLGLVAMTGWHRLRRTAWMRGRLGEETEERSRGVLLAPALMLSLALASWVWAGPVTDTGGHATQVARDAVAAILGQGKDTPGSSDLQYTLFSRDTTTPRERLDLFVGETLDARKQAPRRALLIKHPGKAVLKPDIVSASKLPLTGAGERLESLGPDADSVVTGARFAAAGLIQLLLLVGVVRLVRRRKVADERPALDTPAKRLPEEVVFVSLGTVGALGVIVLVPTLSVDYGVLRAFQQATLVVAPVMAVGLWLLVQRFTSRSGALAAVVPVGLLLVLSGAVPAILGGYSPRLALSNTGTYYDRYFASDSDVQAVDWVAAAGQGRVRPAGVIANRNIGVRVLSVRKDARVADRLYPTLLTKGDYVFVDSRLQDTGRSAVFYTGDLITYRYPLRKLDRQMDLVYSSQLTRIYR